MTQGTFFITVVTDQRMHFLAQADDTKTSLLWLPPAFVIREQWYALVSQLPGVDPGDLAILPDHVHGLINLKGSVALGTVIRRFKAACTWRIRHELHLGFGWQRGYHDHKLRQGELDRYRQYIAENPVNWLKDHAV